MTQPAAHTAIAVEQEIEALRERLGLSAEQTGGLLHDLVALASWVIRQAAAGRVIEARGEDGTHALVHPVLMRLNPAVTAIVLSDEEAERLEVILERGVSLTPALIEVLEELGRPEQPMPALTWDDQSK
jgi:hypothetical protein